MPELSKVLTVTCPTNISWHQHFSGSADAIHLVTFNGGEGYHCTCDGFLYRKRCKHVDESHGLRCGWGADAFANVIRDDKKCPLCGEETTRFYVGV